MDHQFPTVLSPSDGDAGCCRVSLCRFSISVPDNNHHRVAFATNTDLVPSSTSRFLSSTASEDGSAAYSGTGTVLDSVVKIYTVSSRPDFLQPWQSKPQRLTCGSGFVIAGERIITNAHVVANHTFVQVRKHCSPTKFKARVLAVGHECDLAILVVDRQEFWEGMSFLELGDIPSLQEATAVVGYPQGGDSISVTNGIVSRVGPTQYAHGSTQLMAIQIDAAINPGNSGGPALIVDKVVGVAFQNLTGLKNIGCIIPAPVIKHFISVAGESGAYPGLCSLGFHYQPTENYQLRNHFGMLPEMTGVLVNNINPLSDSYRILKKDDIILAFDNVPVGNDGTIPFWNGVRVVFDHMASMKKPNETALIRVLWDGKENEFSITLQPLCERALREFPRYAGEQLIILSEVLMDDINAGYGCLAKLQVRKVNGIEIENLSHLYRLVERHNGDSIRFDLEDEKVIIFDYREAKIATSAILKRHVIPSAASTDLIDKQNSDEDLACPI